MNLKTLSNPKITLKRTLQTALLFDVFWERWHVHGVSLEDIDTVRQTTTSINDWESNWNRLAQQKRTAADQLLNQGLLVEAEEMYRLASLYYNLIYWIFPALNEQKYKWYQECLMTTKLADSTSSIKTEYPTISVGNSNCKGRIRVPTNPRGCIIIVNPIDSSKEELFSYESDFNQSGFVTVSFDGPGQGESYIHSGQKGNRIMWQDFIDNVISHTYERFAGTPIYLFGTSLGATWALYGSSHPLVSKTVAVSPAIEFDHLNLPSYFLQRMDFCNALSPEERSMPDFNGVNFSSPIMLFHGQKDLMVPSSDMYNFYNKLPENKKELIEFEHEGHCCNFKLNEIRKRSIQWFTS
ncbi:alpha/beta hydrolase [Bacillus pinisoli]|uniref:alpha/beta hydrolase n=1 Tax=Bacillus pinisoli TaxID=2901866 RepID=UPI001FF6C3DD|nr:alpha/beta hydrolase [Bacillus pinisoli]